MLMSKRKNYNSDINMEDVFLKYQNNEITQQEYNTLAKIFNDWQESDWFKWDGIVYKGYLKEKTLTGEYIEDIDKFIKKMNELFNINIKIKPMENQELKNEINPATDFDLIPKLNVETPKDFHKSLFPIEKIQERIDTINKDNIEQSKEQIWKPIKTDENGIHTKYENTQYNKEMAEGFSKLINSDFNNSTNKHDGSEITYWNSHPDEESIKAVQNFRKEKTHYENLPNPELVDELVNFKIPVKETWLEKTEKEIEQETNKQEVEGIMFGNPTKSVQYVVGFDPYKKEELDTDIPKKEGSFIVVKYPPKSKVAAIPHDITTEEYKKRRTGQTTRLIDEIVQSLFNGNLVEVKDHPKGGRDLNANLELLEKVLDRFRSEHNGVYIVDYRKNRDRDVTYLIFNSAELTLKLETYV